MRMMHEVIAQQAATERELERTHVVEYPTGSAGGAPVDAMYVTLAVNATLTQERVLTGTANQVVVTDNGAGSTVVLSTPQNIHTAAAPTFAGLTVTGLTPTRVVFVGGADQLTDDADFAFDGAQLVLATQGATGGILVGGDAQWYRSAANQWRTPDSVVVDASLYVGSDQTASLSYDAAAPSTGLNIGLATVAGQSRYVSISVAADTTFPASTSWTLTSGAVTGSFAAAMDDNGSQSVDFTGFTDGATFSTTHATTTPQIIASQASTGDAALRWALGTTTSFAAGIDNSDGDKWKLSYAASGSAVLGTADLFTIIGSTTAPQFGFNTAAPTSFVDFVSADATFPTGRQVFFALYSNDAFPMGFTAAKSRGTTIGSHAVVQSGDVVARLVGQGSDGDQFHAVARMDFIVDGTPGDNDMPGRIVFLTTPDGSTTPVANLTISNDGRIFGAALHNNAGAVTGATNQYLASGTYTPELFNTTNVAVSANYQCQWLRVGNVVTVSGKVDIDPTLAGNTVLGISLPIASNLGSDEDLAGAASAPGAAAQGAALLGDAANNRATMQYVAIAAALGNLSYYFTFIYEVI